MQNQGSPVLPSPPPSLVVNSFHPRPPPKPLPRTSLRQQVTHSYSGSSHSSSCNDNRMTPPLPCNGHHLRPHPVPVHDSYSSQDLLCSNLSNKNNNNNGPNKECCQQHSVDPHPSSSASLPTTVSNCNASSSTADPSAATKSCSKSASSSIPSSPASLSVMDDKTRRLSWNNSIRNFLRDEEAVKYWREYLMEEGGEEYATQIKNSVDFWNTVNGFRIYPEEGVTKLRDVIYSKYLMPRVVRDGSVKPAKITISQGILDSITDYLVKAGARIPNLTDSCHELPNNTLSSSVQVDRCLFDAAQDEIEFYVLFPPYHNFLASDKYRDLINEDSKNQSSKSDSSREDNQSKVDKLRDQEAKPLEMNIQDDRKEVTSCLSSNKTSEKKDIINRFHHFDPFKEADAAYASQKQQIERNEVTGGSLRGVNIASAGDKHVSRNQNLPNKSSRIRYPDPLCPPSVTSSCGIRIDGREVRNDSCGLHSSCFHSRPGLSSTAFTGTSGVRPMDTSLYPPPSSYSLNHKFMRSYHESIKLTNVPHPYHTKYIPVVFPSAQESEVSAATASSGSASHVSLPHFHPHRPISKKEEKAAIRRMKASVNDNANVILEGQPYIPRPASIFRSAVLSGTSVSTDQKRQAEYERQKLRTARMATESPEDFYDLLIEQLDKLFSEKLLQEKQMKKETKRREEEAKRRAMSEASGSKTGASRTTAENIALRAKFPPDDDSAQDILDSHVRQWPDWGECSPLPSGTVSPPRSGHRVAGGQAKDSYRSSSRKRR